MTDEHLPFLQSVIASPDDDLPRLIYADWLMEHGDAQAEFIRVQCELATVLPQRCINPKQPRQNPNARHIIERGPQPCGRCRWCALRRRERALLEANIPGDLCNHRTLWAGRAASLLPRGRYEFRRGFVEEITCPWADCQAHLGAIRGETPLRKVRMTDWPPSIRGQRVRPDGGTYPVRMWRLLGRERYWRITGTMSESERSLKLLGFEWPGVEFELPEPSLDAVQVTDLSTATLRDLAALRLQDVAVGLNEALALRRLLRRTEQPLALGDAGLGVTQGGN